MFQFRKCLQVRAYFRFSYPLYGKQVFAFIKSNYPLNISRRRVFAWRFILNDDILLSKTICFIYFFLILSFLLKYLQ